MLARFKRRNRNRQIVDDLYAALVERSRQPALFTNCGLPDTVMGRYESLSIHVFLFLVRCRGDSEAKPVAQDLVDRFMADVEDSIREIGIGDVAVPKRMRKLAGMFYERVGSYDPPLTAGDPVALAAALSKHALPGDAPPQDGLRLAAYLLDTNAAFAAIPIAAVLSGRLMPQV